MANQEEKKVKALIERNDVWFITDNVLSLACYTVAEQFVNDEDRMIYTPTEFAERCTYVMRQLCPIVYSYFFQYHGGEQLPHGTIQIILQCIKEQRVLFTVQDLRV